MDDYLRATQILSTSKTNLEFDIQGLEHTAIVLSCIIDNARNNVKIFSRSLSGSIANQPIFTKSLNKYIESKKELTIVLEHMQKDETKISSILKRIKGLSNHPSYNIKLKTADDLFIKKVKKLFKDNHLYYFTVSDSAAYMIEINKDKHKAVCNFNDTFISSKLDSIFS